MIESQERADCTVLAVATVFGIEYAHAHSACALAGRRRSFRFSLWPKIETIAKRFDATVRDVTDSLPKKRATLRRAHIYAPTGRYLAWTRGHVSAVIDGVVHDRDDVATSRRQVLRLVRIDMAKQKKPARPASEINNEMGLLDLDVHIEDRGLYSLVTLRRDGRVVLTTTTHSGVTPDDAHIVRAIDGYLHRDTRSTR